MGSQSLRSPETSTQLGELLRYTDHENSRSHLTIGSVLNLEKKPGSRSTGRTLLDIIQADSTGDSKITWTNFRDKLRLKRATAALQRINNHGHHQRILSDPDIESESSRIRSSSLRLQRSLSSLSEEEEQEQETEGEGPLRMSLMSLLAETDREMGNEPAYVIEDEAGQVEVEVENDGGSGEVNDCCVCMERHKGSAFIPCGHTFCRLCSRELYVQRGNCPICNGFILEILDIF
ncbi:hypothetical protein DCAR_0100292 [Daucus carota subsp. sativus]|uniref:RING-type domain-containing protein n=1 Tax=Daucus carota subsp. sativus TaxID=79200 RepID=A0A166FJP2_DAUCS|nr:PREDICTED: LON peptidase N-terminal domain and RING finger protein 3-like [Daucus carota subsp. sativus]WOG81147.1 hypothetical protein DCAR_0100292 [Daucus carota subsp. sativus]